MSLAKSLLLIIVLGTLLFSVSLLAAADAPGLLQTKSVLGGAASRPEIASLIHFDVRIDDVADGMLGHYAFVSITYAEGEGALSGFDYLVAYDALVLSFVVAELGDGPAACGWEYFTYQYGAQGDCGGTCPYGLLRIVALADLNNGSNYPTCYDLTPGSELAQLKFRISNNCEYSCMYTPIRFAWMECDDNAMSNVGGDTSWILSSVSDYFLGGPAVDITNIDCGEGTFPHFGGYCDPACLLSGPNVVPVPRIDFYNGGVDIVCYDSLLCGRGDLNLDGISYDISDLVMLTNYMLHGIIAFPVLGRDQALRNADIDGDGRIGLLDFIHFMRIINGDALPYPKLAPFASGATVNFANGSVSTESANEIGAVYATFTVNGAYTVASNSDMQVESAEVNGELKVLVYSGLSNLSNRLTAGSNNLFTVNGDVELKSVEVADYNGNMLNTRVNKTSLPKAFALSQNVPNPFNPTTKIGFALPNQSEWTLSIYNVAGQLVKNFSGNSVGDVSVEWDASMVPSGVYFYKLNAGSFAASKKMVLMK